MDCKLKINIMKKQSYYQKNKEKILAKKKQDRENLTDSYVKQLRQKLLKPYNAKICDPTPEEIETYRGLIKLKRGLILLNKAIKEVKDEEK